MAEDRPENEERAEERRENRRGMTAISVRDAPPDDPGEVMTQVPHAREIGMRLHRAVGGRSLLSVPYDERLVGDPDSGVLHGGVVTALLDTACGAAVLSMPTRLDRTATLDLRIDYMRPATVGQTVRAEAECYRMTRSIAFVRAVAYHEDADDPIAAAAGAFMLEREAG